MTIGIERTYAINNTREFLRDLLDPFKTPRIPKEIRKKAYWLLKHYPSEFDMQVVKRKCPKLFGELK